MLNELKNWWYSIGEVQDIPSLRDGQQSAKYVEYRKWCADTGAVTMSREWFDNSKWQRCKTSNGNTVYCNPRS